MKRDNSYHLFLFFTTFVRGLVEAFSLVLLYKKGFNIDEILLFMFFMYLFGIIVNYVSLKVNFKVVLIMSSLLYGISYLFLNYMDTSLISLVIFSLLLSFSTYSYHCIRHYLALCYKVKNTAYIVNVMFCGLILASMIGTFIVSKLSIFIVSIILIGLSLISLIPVFKVRIVKEVDNNKRVNIGLRKLLFNVFEQFKVVFLELQPLFLYLYVNDSISYVGWFNIVINISSLVVLFFISKRMVSNKFVYICLVFSFILLIKISITSKVMMFLVAVIEGILVKVYERFSLVNLYDIGNNSINRYLMVEELIFFGSKSLIMGIFLLVGLKLKSIMFLCIIGIIISGFMFERK